MGENQDISKIIGIIMENPDIIARIKALADTKETPSDTKGAAETVALNEPSSSERVSEPPASSFTKGESKKRRRELLYALKPYVKNERAKAIDTMLSVIDVIDVMKER